MASPGNEKFSGAYDARYGLDYDKRRRSEAVEKLVWFEKYYELCYANLPKDQLPKGAKVRVLFANSIKS